MELTQRTRDVLLCIIALFLSLGLLTLGNSILGTLLAVRLELEGYSSSLAGLVLAGYSLGFVLGSIFGIRIVKRVGHIRAFATFGVVATAAVLLHSLHLPVAGWMALRVMVGACVAGLMLVTESWVNARATEATRGSLLAVYMIVFYLAAVLIALSMVPLSLTHSPAPELHEGNRLGIGELMRLSSIGLLAALLSGVVMSAFSAVGPLRFYFAIQRISR